MNVYELLAILIVSCFMFHVSFFSFLCIVARLSCAFYFLVVALKALKPFVDLHFTLRPRNGMVWCGSHLFARTKLLLPVFRK